MLTGVMLTVSSRRQSRNHAADVEVEEHAQIDATPTHHHADSRLRRCRVSATAVHDSLPDL